MLHSAIPQDNGNLRPHQIKAKDDILHAWDDCSSVMLQMPTGTGKTYLFTSLVCDLLRFYKTNHKKLTILVVAHRMELLDQIGASLTRYGIPHGFIQGNRQQHLWQRVQVGSIMSLLTTKNELNVHRLDFDYIIVDEAHHSLAETYKKLFEAFPHARKLGVTATPWRLNHESFLSLYSKLITTPQVSWFIREGLLADFDYVSIKPDSEIQRLVNNSEVLPTGEFSNSDLDNTFNSQRIRAKLLDSYNQFAKGRKGIIYTINKQHAANVAAMYSANGVRAVAIDCDTPKEERQQLIDAFKCGQISVLVNVEIFTEGFDCPDVSFIQLARPTRSLALYLQQVGRGLRVVEGKEKTIILDNVGLYNYFGLPDANRQWQKHFIGKETPDELFFGNSEGSKVQEFDPYDLLEEDNEEMMIVRGSGSIARSNIKNVQTAASNIREFNLVDYYLVRGCAEKFKVYPFVKNHGKRTEGVTNCILEYDSSSRMITFGRNIRENLESLAANAKLQTIVTFAASMCDLSLRDVMNLTDILNEEERMSAFELLETIDKVFRIAQNTQTK